MFASGKALAAANPMSLEGRNIMVTGAGQGIGRAIAEVAVGLGGRVLLTDINPIALEEVAAAGWLCSNRAG
jgi:3-oxoacyl-[acyl-carrier protein] reductase